jgi:hypothetical protein
MVNKIKQNNSLPLHLLSKVKFYYINGKTDFIWISSVNASQKCTWTIFSLLQVMLSGDLQRMKRFIESVPSVKPFGKFQVCNTKMFPFLSALWSSWLASNSQTRLTFFFYFQSFFFLLTSKICLALMFPG